MTACAWFYKIYGPCWILCLIFARSYFKGSTCMLAFVLPDTLYITLPFEKKELIYYSPRRRKINKERGGLKKILLLLLLQIPTCVGRVETEYRDDTAERQIWCISFWVRTAEDAWRNPMSHCIPFPKDDQFTITYTCSHGKGFFFDNGRLVTP